MYGHGLHNQADKQYQKRLMSVSAKVGTLGVLGDLCQPDGRSDGGSVDFLGKVSGACTTKFVIVKLLTDRPGSSPIAFTEAIDPDSQEWISALVTK